MKDFRETNFKKIQQLLDKCVAHEYGMRTNALALKREYLTEAQMKDYIRQEIFNLTENLVSLCQKNHALHNIRFDILMPDFLWESGSFENLSLLTSGKNIFRSNVLLLIWTNTCNLPLAMMSSFRSFLPLCALSCRPNIWNTSNNRRTPVMPLFLWMRNQKNSQKKKKGTARADQDSREIQSVQISPYPATNQTAGRMYQRSAHIHHDNHPENPFGLLRLQTERGLEVQQQPLAGLSDDAA